ncbi:MAG TPA: hypothetical protein VK634_15685, partial [Reyranella sp.]|nr:hypothetical protein [Reyranella sp.]
MTSEESLAERLFVEVGFIASLRRHREILVAHQLFHCRNALGIQAIPAIDLGAEAREIAPAVRVCAASQPVAIVVSDQLTASRLQPCFGIVRRQGLRRQDEQDTQHGSTGLRGAAVAMASGYRFHGAIEIHDPELDDDLGLALQDLDSKLAQGR